MKGRDSYRHGPVAEVLTAANLSDLYDVAIARADFAGGGKFTYAPFFGRSS